MISELMPILHVDVQSRYPINFAMVNAAVAASPPTRAVCHALRNGRVVVKRPFTYPNTSKASNVTPADQISP